MKIAIIGAGGVGGQFGLRLAKAGNEVHFVAHPGPHFEAMKSNGLQLTSPHFGDAHLSDLSVTDNSKSLEPVDVVLLCTKLYDLEDAAQAAAPLLRDDSVVIPLQNGVESVERITPILGEQHVIVGSTFTSSHIEKPGHIKHVGRNQILRFGSNHAFAKPFYDACVDAGLMPEIYDDPEQMLWKKFIYLSSISGILATLRKPMKILKGPPLLQTMLDRAVDEAAAVGRAHGANIDDALIQAAKDDTRENLDEFRPSLLVDVERGKRTEVEWLSGAVHRLGQKHGVDTPLHSMFYAAVTAYESQSNVAGA
ncbi:MAG: 2-dehydropantoate 2-reductase [Gammaproteobacteria bacterium]|nr:2-dehydropantoate 2-reductase [Gammaproteobacteria bacterium]